MQYTSERKDAIVDRLETLGVKKCLVQYSGGGDSGAINEISAFLTHAFKDPQDVDELVRSLETDENEIVINVRDRLLGEKTSAFSEQIEQLAYDALDHVDAADWVNNEGGRGTLIIDVESGIIEIEHEMYGETVYEGDDDEDGTQGESDHAAYTLT